MYTVCYTMFGQKFLVTATTTSSTGTVFFILSEVEKHIQSLFRTGPMSCNLVKSEGPEVDYDRPWASGSPVIRAL